MILSLFCAAGQEGLHIATVIPLAAEGSAVTHSEGCCICLGWENDVFFVLVEAGKEREMVGVVTRVIMREKIMQIRIEDELCILPGLKIISHRVRSLLSQVSALQKYVCI